MGYNHSVGNCDHLRQASASLRKRYWMPVRHNGSNTHVGRVDMSVFLIRPLQIGWALRYLQMGREKIYTLENPLVHVKAHLQEFKEFKFQGHLVCCPVNILFEQSKRCGWDLPGRPVVKISPSNAGGVDLISGLGRSPGVENGNVLQYSCLENFMDRGAWWTTVHGVAKSWTWLSE